LLPDSIPTDHLFPKPSHEASGPDCLEPGNDHFSATVRLLARNPITQVIRPRSSGFRL